MSSEGPSSAASSGPSSAAAGGTTASSSTDASGGGAPSSGAGAMPADPSADAGAGEAPVVPPPTWERDEKMWPVPDDLQNELLAAGKASVHCAAAKYPLRPSLRNELRSDRSVGSVLSFL
jgi:hypothetical protein